MIAASAPAKEQSDADQRALALEDLIKENDARQSSTFKQARTSLLKPMRSRHSHPIGFLAIFFRGVQSPVIRVCG